MEAATVEAPEEAVELEDVTFYSPCHDLKITVRGGAEVVKNARGEILTPSIPAYFATFEGGQITTALMRKQAIDHAQPDPDEATVEAIAAIRSLDTFNTGSRQGVWEEGAHPDEPKPTQKEMLDLIARAGQAADHAALQELIDSENATHKRPAVLMAAETLLKVIPDGSSAE